MPYVIPPVRAGGQSGHIADHNEMGADLAWVGPSWQPSDHGLVSWSYDPALSSSSSSAITPAGTAFVVAVKVPQATSVTNILMYLVANGATLTAGQCFAALYAGAGGALIGQTADQSTAWGAGASKMVTMALSGGPFTVAAGTLYIAFWFNGTTGPAFARGDGTAAGPKINVGLAAAASRFGTANTGLTTTAPATLGTIAQGGIAFWAALS